MATCVNLSLANGESPSHRESGNVAQERRSDEVHFIQNLLFHASNRDDKTAEEEKTDELLSARDYECLEPHVTGIRGGS
ncbi:hypothetical protein EVAR_95578_1 [Eumeta japonica]|uniref:Uncharacterized protein n=1 Tax=Eumeta variegata TaxID=151549 RepID=A0A4C1SGL6_EUMVA|nr:hypothetical protein EVAR_95578_1 [Eumeta japonica]